MEINNHVNKAPVALILADCHCGKETVSDFLINWNEAIGICVSKDIRQILFLGDLVLSRSAQTLDILLAIHDVLADCMKRHIRVTMINGNHCKVNQESLRGYCNVFDSFENVRVINEWGELEFPDNLGVGLISYFPENGSFTDKLEQLEKQMFAHSYRKLLLMIHEGIRGGLLQSTENELPTTLFSGWDCVLVGHYHNRCHVGDNVEYIGASRQSNFGEDEEKGYTLLYPDGSCEFIKNRANTRYRVIDVPIEKVDIHLSDRLEEIKEDGRYRVKVRVHASSAQASALDKEKLMTSGASKVEVVTEDLEIKEIAESSFFEKFDSRKIKESYERFCDEKQIEDVELGLSYLAKIELPCGN